MTAGDGHTIIAVTGELDIARADEFVDAIRSALADSDVFLDLRDVVFMDSSGVRALNTVLRAASESGRALTIHPDLHRNVVQVLELTGMLPLLPLGEAA